MAYIRVKNINDKKYAYLVETITTPAGPRQKVVQYLGKVYQFSTIKDLPIESNASADTRDFLIALTVRELTSLGFVERKDGAYVNEEIIFDKDKFSLTKKRKNIVIPLHGGYLSAYTLQRILNFRKSDDLDTDARTLAEAFIQAGLRISEQEFVSFYQLL